MPQRRLIPLCAMLTLFAHGAARAQTGYRVQPILRVGEVTADRTIPANNWFWIGGHGEQGELFISWWNPSKPQEGEYVIHLANGTSTLVAAPGLAAPDGTWPKDLFTQQWAMNHRGAALFTVTNPRPGGGIPLYRFDPQTKQLTAPLKRSTPLSEGYTIQNLGFGLWLNDHDEMVLAAQARDSSNKLGFGIFLQGKDGRWQTVLAPRQQLPSGATVKDEPARFPYLLNSGAVTFVARGEAEKQFSAFLWEQGSLKSLLAVGSDAPGGGKITGVSGIFATEATGAILLAAGVDGKRDHGLYRLADGKLTPIVVPGQEMPGGGVFKTLRYTQDSGFGAVLTNGVGFANLKGQHAFLATLQEGIPAIYRLDPDGKISLVLKQGQITAAGTITSLGQRSTLSGSAPAPLINGKGEIVTLAEIDGGPRSVVLLTPVTP